MARTLYLADGSCEVLLSVPDVIWSEDTPKAVKLELERIIRERLGSDAANLFNSLFPEDEAAGESTAISVELRNYEVSLEHYHAILQDTAEALQDIITDLSPSRRVCDALQIQVDNIQREL